ncbi:hypothetical protein LOZ12_006075 [Ophidiomyces ophidiicola]|uniref:Uncharacterized protein n=1 Tax=Ophidiomyces ophidiicola TaxID=1387563 RepID=A0ACB8UV02_9EURO|nr:hypothetical protein LOZ64_005461 [Ophidiomyces ophidiicola]KAI1934737.1 hypothetical protein LOZ62_006187 [Ophidiomyces ophidiicola]KAI1952360.1 hypothetical protein LOZ59_005439 [Ophidiomyces ophidiicola]KAI1969217.1 hypothetical protein LOZ56_004636 [Ophidiomyces ophidiicola]KAI2000205.1 hypothetical protein LOZ50_006139 [Ophidiomyces ophidiicola]
MNAVRIFTIITAYHVLFSHKCSQKLFETIPSRLGRVRDMVLGFIVRHSPLLLQRLVIQLCPPSWLVSLSKYTGTYDGYCITPCVLSLSSDIVVQYGIGITSSRAAMQEYAYKRVDQAVVRIPKVYRFFMYRSANRSCSYGYLFMEYMKGKTVLELDEATENNEASTALTKQISGIAVHLLSIKAPDGTPPGPVNGAPPDGYLWGDDGSDTAFASAADWNTWLNRRLKIINKSIDISPYYPLVICHGDFVRRNIIVLDDNKDSKTNRNYSYEGRQLALVDWGFAALLPRMCEFASMFSYNDEGGYQYTLNLLLATKDEIGGLTQEEEECFKLLVSARAMCLRYTRL